MLSAKLSFPKSIPMCWCFDKLRVRFLLSSLGLKELFVPGLKIHDKFAGLRRMHIWGDMRLHEGSGWVIRGMAAKFHG